MTTTYEGSSLRAYETHHDESRQPAGSKKAVNSASVAARTGSAPLVAIMRLSSLRASRSAGFTFLQQSWKPKVGGHVRQLN